MSALLNKLNEINELRKIELQVGLSEFQRGQLSGAQYVLVWLTGWGSEPVVAFLTDDQIRKAVNMPKVDTDEITR